MRSFPPIFSQTIRLVAQSVGLKKGSALMAVMRKMRVVAVHLLTHEQEDYDRSLVAVGNLAG
jgi:hypothetical protein